MKAVILVGGLGTRLRPLTCKVPKPMLPLLNRPFIEYIIKHLKKHGIDEIIFSAGYLPAAFEDHFKSFGDLGVGLTFVAEKQPLGTCGAVKNVEHLLDGTFMVFNGDILTDLNVSHLVDYHRSKQAVATIALTSVDDPTSYGLVPLDASGRVEGFLEKPNWDEVTTDLINAGTYVLEPRLLKLVPKGENYSFERGLFPALLEKRQAVYGFPSGAYWLDIGSPEKYLRAHHDLLEGKLEFEFAGNEVRPRVWVGSGSTVSDTASLYGPVLVGRDCRIDDHVSVVGPTVIGDGCHLGPGVRIERSVILEKCRLAESAVVKSSILGRHIKIGRKVHVEEISVLGDKMTVGDENWLKKGIKIWPETKIMPGTIRF